MADEELNPAQFAARVARRIVWPLLLLPPLVGGAGLVLLKDAPRAEWKDALELAAMVILWSAVGLVLARSVVQRRPFLWWLLALAGVLLFREYHLLKAATTLTLIGLAVLAFVLWRGYATFREYLDAKLVATLLAMIVVSYATSTIVDADRFKFAEGITTFPVVEELIECTGHMCVLILTALATRRCIAAEYEE